MIYGFLNGAVDVFPYNSTMDLCRDNITTVRDLSDNLFMNPPYTFPDDNLLYVYDVAELFTIPYGIAFNCLYGAQRIFKFQSKVAETSDMTEKQKRANDQIIINNIVTNFIYNMGFVYSDILGVDKLDGANLNYWTDLGAYGGDLMMRFFYREDYQETFSYDLIDDCDTTRESCRS